MLSNVESSTIQRFEKMFKSSIKNDKGGLRNLPDHFEAGFLLVTYVIDRDLLFIHQPINMF